MSVLEIVGWALVHFVWQGALVAVLTAAALAALRRSPPTNRYAVAVVGLAAMTLCPIVTAWMLSSGAASDQGRGLMPALGLSVGKAETRAPGLSAFVSQVTDAPAPASASAASGKAAATVAWREPLARFGERGAELAARAMPWVVSCWAVGVALLSMRLAGGWVRARRLRLHGVAAPPDWCRVRVSRLAARLKVRSVVRVFESSLVDVPLVMGSLRPVILVPASAFAGLTPDQLEAILAHELAHVRRHDYLVNLLQSCVETLLFYHPAIWWVSRQVRLEREHCCDDIAVGLCGNREGYARALVGMERLRFAAAIPAVRANGGSLVMRVRRLLTPELSHVDAASRSTASVIGIAAALTVGAAASVPSMVSPDVRGLPAEPPAVVAAAAQPSSNAAPVIVKAPDLSAPLADRWSWAERESKTRGWTRYWVGYSLQPPAALSPFIYSDRATRVTGDGSSFSGTFTGDGARWRFPGVAIGPLVGGGDARRVKVLFSFGRDAYGRVALVRTHASSFDLPVELENAPLVWLGDAEAIASLPLVERLYAQTSAPGPQTDLITLLALHGDSSRVVPILTRILNSDAGAEVRAEAAERLGWHPTDASLAALDRAARQDRALHVRTEAAETMGELDLPAAFDALVALAKTVDTVDVRREAVEALGERPEPAAREALVAIARGDRSRDVQREAVETLGELEAVDTVPALIDLARTHPDADVRREAIETIGEAAPSEQATAFLTESARQQTDVNVQREAIETLAEIDDSKNQAILIELATTHASPEARARAIEAVTHSMPPDEATAFLTRVIRDERNTEVQKQAVEQLGEVEASGAVAALAEIARTHASLEVRREAIETLGETAVTPAVVETLTRLATEDQSVDVQREAVETLGELEGGQGVAAIAKFALSHPSADVRREAIETLAEHAPQPTAIDVLKRIVDTDPSEDASRAALEALSEMHDGAGVPTVIDIARTHPNPEMRREALKQLVESEDPRARAVFERVLSSKP